MPTQNTFTFDEHDKLNRKPFAEFLFSLIQHNKEYRRPDSDGGYAIAIDAAYGSGKTRFLQMFQSLVKEEGGFNVAYYSAWEHDLYDDALAPILSLLDRPAGVFEEQAYLRMEQTLGVRALHVLKRMGTSFLSMKAKKHFGDDYNDIIDDIKALFNEESDSPDAYDLRMKCIEELRNGLRKATETSPLILIIDELDRCNPAFAIKTLEVTKHLLNIENVTFVYALDMQEMQAAVKKFYGQEINASGYLHKVFDYMTTLPPPDTDHYIRAMFSPLDDATMPAFNQFVSNACELLIYGNCTLRFIDTIITTFRIMWHSFLKRDYSVEAWTLYFSILYLKYTHPNLYITAINTTTATGAVRSELRKYLSRDNILVNFYDFFPEVVNTYSPASPLNKQVIRFFSDPAHYDEIDQITYGQFIHRQLEMYNPIRTEEPTSSTPTT